MKEDFQAMRRAMVASQLRTTGVNDPRVLAAMGEVRRELFVPEERQALAYADACVPLVPGRDLNSPMAIGRLLTEAGPRASDRALVVGAATGYSAALLARLTASVVALEEDPSLAARAKALLAPSGVAVIQGPLKRGHAKGAPYDLILVDGAVELVPDSLIAQLSDGGRLAAAILDEGVIRIAIGRKAGEGFAMLCVADVAAAILPGFAKPPAFAF